jgi:hypothetical protein
MANSMHWQVVLSSHRGESFSDSLPATLSFFAQSFPIRWLLADLAHEPLLLNSPASLRTDQIVPRDDPPVLQRIVRYENRRVSLTKNPVEFKWRDGLDSFRERASADDAYEGQAEWLQLKNPDGPVSPAILSNEALAFQCPQMDGYAVWRRDAKMPGDIAERRTDADLVNAVADELEDGALPRGKSIDFLHDSPRFDLDARTLNTPQPCQCTSARRPNMG